MHGIRVERHGEAAKISLTGEFDVCALPGLRRALDGASGGDVCVDLSAVTFLDLRTARELVVRSVLQAPGLRFENPSPNAAASFRALGVGEGAVAPSDPKEPPVFSST